MFAHACALNLLLPFCPHFAGCHCFMLAEVSRKVRMERKGILGPSLWRLSGIVDFSRPKQPGEKPEYDCHDYEEDYENCQFKGWGILRIG
jgi:hypothetical protein